MLAEERKQLPDIGPRGLVDPLPDHLVGVPVCLHKYEPLLERAWLERGAAEARRSASG